MANGNGGSSGFYTDGKLVKKAGDKHDVPMTEEEKQEWLRCAEDKSYFFEKYVFIQTPKGRENFVPRPYQWRVIRKAEDERFTIGLGGRQIGKTQTYAADVIHDTIFTRDYNIGITSFKNSNCLDYMDRIRFIYENLPWFLKPACQVYNRSNIRFDNGSSISAQVTAENTFRGRTLQRIIVDELAFVKLAVSEEFIGSLLPSISADGENSTTRLNIISTANGSKGVFASLWFGAVIEANGFAAVEIKYEEVPGRTPEFEAQMVRKIGRNKFDQEYRNKFLSSGGTLVASRVLEAISPMEPVSHIGDLLIFKEENSLKGKTVMVTCDVSEGIEMDNHCIQVTAMEPEGHLEQIAEYTNNNLPQTLFFNQILNVLKWAKAQKPKEVFYSFENNGIGAGIARLMENSDDPILEECILISDLGPDGTPGKRIGMMTTGKSKEEGCMNLKDLFELHRLVIHSKYLLTELKFFMKKGRSFEAEVGATDDRVMAMVQMANMVKQTAYYEDGIDRVINSTQVDDEVYEIYF